MKGFISILGHARNGTDLSAEAERWNLMVNIKLNF